MQVILLDKVAKLGCLGEQVNVTSGYARNFLFPKGKAVLATKQNIAYFDARRTELEVTRAKIQERAEARAKNINELGKVTITSKAGEEGKLFGSIGTRNIAEAITTAGIPVTKSEVRLPHGILRTTGNHEVRIQVHSEVFASLNVVVVAET